MQHTHGMKFQQNIIIDRTNKSGQVNNKVCQQNNMSHHGEEIITLNPLTPKI